MRVQQVFAVAVVWATASACESGPACGAGTRIEGSVCVPASIDGGDDAAAAAGGDASRADAGPPVLPPDVHELDGIGAGGSDTAYAPLDPMVRDAEIVALGSGSPTSGGYDAIRARAFRYLVEHHGFRVLAIDARWQDWQHIEAELCAGSDPRDALRRDIEGVYASEEFAELASFVCAWNASHPDDRIVLFPFRGMAVWSEAPAQRALLEEVAGADAPALVAGLSPCTGANQSHRELLESLPLAMTGEAHAACIAGLDAVDAWIAAHEQEIVAARGETELAYARLRGRSMRAIEQYYWHIDDASIATGNEPDRSTAYSTRFAHDYDSFAVHRAIRAPERKVVVFASDSSIVRHIEDIGLDGPVSLGSQLHLALGARYVPIITLAHREASDWPLASLAGEQPPRDGTRAIERRLHELGRPWLLADFHDETVADRFLDPGELVSWFTTVPFDIAAQAEGALFLDRSEAFHSLLW